MKLFRPGLLGKFAISFYSIIIIGSFLLAFFLISLEKTRVINDLKDKGLSHAINVSYSSETGILDNNRKVLNVMLRNLMKDDDFVYSQIINSRGMILAGLQKGNRPKEPIYNISVPIESVKAGESEGGFAHVIGEVKIGISLAKADKITAQIFRSMFLLVFGIMVCGLIAVDLFSRYFLINPLKELVVGTRKIAEGDLDYTITIASNDEIGDLADSFNRMTSRLEKSREEIENYSENLEEKVRIRTAELQETMEKLKVVDRMKTEFLSVISHELKTPLTPIHEYSSLLSDKILGPLDENQVKAVKTIQRQSGVLNDLIDNLLDISRLEIGKPVSLKKEIVSISSLLAEIKETVMAEIEKAGLVYEEDIPADIPTVYADPGALKRLILNLIGNSIKFTPKSGKIKVSASNGENAIRFSVEDTGIGIAAEHIEKVFEKFYQVDSSYTREAGGIGMGLPIAREIVEAHGGKIWAESKGIGHGAKICFEIPLA